MKNSVKITTFSRILDLFYPCYCKGCGKFGYVFCHRCYFYNSRYNPPFSTKNDEDFNQILVSGLKEGVLEELVKDYKYHSRRHYAPVFGGILNETIKRVGELGEKTVIVPLPTALKHIRLRGFDHIDAIAREFSRLSGFPVLKVLERAFDTVQVGSSNEERKKQARRAYRVSREDFERFLDIFSEVDLRKTHFLLVDDVWTTGASMRAAGKVLKGELIRRGIKLKDIKISAIVILKNNGYEFN